MTLLDRDRAHIWHPYTQAQTAPAPLPIARGEGVFLYTEAEHKENGRKILDGISSWWVNIHGHAHPKLNAALAAQAAKIEHVLFAGCTHAPAVELAERLIAILPVSDQAALTRIFYSDNGSTAVEAAIKMALQYWHNRGEIQRTRLITLDHAYHGDTVGAMSASADSLFTRAFSPLLFSVTRAHAPYCHRCPLGLNRASCNIDCLSSLEQQLAVHNHTVAAVLVEPMLQGAGGMIVWPREFLAGVRQLCDRYGVLMIADEVLTGFGRTGRMFACQHAGISPDIICLSKALTAGYLPMGVTAATENIYNAFLSDDRAKTFFHGHSYTANPLACAVAIASLDLFEETNALAAVARLEQHMLAELTPLRELQIVEDVRILGGVGILELNGTGYLDQLGPRLAAAFLDRGLLLRPLGNVLYFMPPYVITEDQTQWAIEQISAVLRAVK